MKKIVVALIVVAVLAGIGLSLYFFVFKNKNMSNEQANNLMTRMAIDAGVEEEYRDAPTIKDFPGSGGEKNVINSSKLPSLSELDFGNWVDLAEDSVKVKIKNLIAGLLDFMGRDKLKEEKVYLFFSDEGNICKINYKTIEHEIIFTIETVKNEKSNVSYVSVFYDNTDEEFEINIISRILDKGLNFIRTKINDKGISRIEAYSYNIVTSDIETAIKNKEGTTSQKILDYANNKMRNTAFPASTDDNQILAGYVNQVYKNFTSKLKDTLKLVTKETDLIYMEPIYSAIFI